LTIDVTLIAQLQFRRSATGLTPVR
jgi:hypothetical protein